MGKCRCKMPPGVVIKPDGINEFDPCVYELKEIHHNVTVEILQCKECGHISIGWYAQEDTESEYLSEIRDELPDDDDQGITIQIRKEETEEDENDETRNVEG